MVTIYCYDGEGYYLGISSAQEGPFGEGPLMPAQCTLEDPGSPAENKIKKWNGSAWTEVDDPAYLVQQAQIAEQQAIDAAAADEAYRMKLCADHDTLNGEISNRAKEDKENTHFAIYDTTDDNKIVTMDKWVYNTDWTDTVPKHDGVLISDPSKAHLAFCTFEEAPDKEAAMSANSHGVKLKKINNGVVVDRTQEDIDAETLPLAEIALRSQRNKKLSKCDFTQLNDNGLDQTAKDNWATYRQALRDLPDNTPDPLDITWPTAPVTPLISGVNT